MYTWQVSRFLKEYYMNAEHIFPTAQRAVGEIVKRAKEVPEVRRVTIFGSCVFPTHHFWNDVDVFIEGCTPEQFGRIKLPDNKPKDLWFDCEVGQWEKLRKEIERDGVVVYERSEDLL